MNEYEKLVEGWNKEHTLRVNAEFQRDKLLRACQDLTKATRNTGLIGEEDNQDLELTDMVIAAEVVIAEVEKG